MDIPTAWFLPAKSTVSIRRASDLVLSQMANDLRREVTALTAKPGFARHHYLQSQIRRCAAGACAAIADGFTREDPHDFARFIRTARLQIDDLRNQISQAKSLGLVPAGEADRLRMLADRASASAGSLMRYLQSC